MVTFLIDDSKVSLGAIKYYFYVPIL